MGNGQVISENTGLRVISVQKEAPGQTAGLYFFLLYFYFFLLLGLVPFMDFIISVEKKKLESLFDFQAFIKDNEDKTLVFEIYNVYKQSRRFQQIYLNRNWPNSDGLLGIKVRVENFFTALEQTYKILKVNSLVNPLKDGEYLLGSPSVIIESFDDFQLALTNTNRQEMAVYNTETKELRQIIIKCGRGVGIGCEVGQGKIHELKIGEDECVIVNKIEVAEEVEQDSVDDVNQIIEERIKPAISETQLNALHAKRVRKGSSQKILKDPFQLGNAESEKIESLPIKNDSQSKKEIKMEDKQKEELNSNNNNNKNEETAVIKQSLEVQQEDKEHKLQTEDKQLQQESDSNSEEIIQLDSEKEESVDLEQSMTFYCEKYQRNYKIKQSDLFQLNIELLNEY